MVLYHPIHELVNSDTSSIILGSDNIKCTLAGAAIGGLVRTSIFHLPPCIVVQGLNALSGSIVCRGIVKSDLLNSNGNVNVY